MQKAKKSKFQAKDCSTDRADICAPVSFAMQQRSLVSDSSIRSIKRSFEIFELFDEKRTPMSATDIARCLDTPLSSMLDLLKSISSLGYITYDSRARTYFPSLRISLLGDWIQTSLLGDVTLLEMLEEIQGSAPETVAISAINDLDMQYLWVSRGRQAISLNIEEGQITPIFSTSVGQALMARWSDSEIKTFVKRFNRRRPGGAVSEASALAAATAVRDRGYASVYDQATLGVGSIALGIPLAYDRNLVISVGGPTDRIRKDEQMIAKALCEAARKYNANARTGDPLDQNNMN
ncbi:IclR family transcriptional regulator [Blastomonas fulva]|uniref:IclR family transcriptional regulator n=1 Tax=Blastomonas fulva TaxID=1550728 RepID=UPI003F6E97BD